MFWVFSGGLLIVWEVIADRLSLMKVSEAAHHFPWAFIPLGWMVTLAWHYFLEWRRCVAGGKTWD